jgi:hypothetical protein
VYDCVATAVDTLNDQIEGVCPIMYVDVKNLVTCAVGYLIDDGSGQAPANCLALPWKHGVNGPLATADEVRAAWLVVKHSGLAGIGGGSPKFAALTDLRLDAAGIDQATRGWIADAEPYLRKYFPGYDTTQADAQLAVLLMAYALGPAFSPEWPHFTAAFNASPPEFAVCAIQGKISTAGNPGVIPRDADIVELFTNAANWLQTDLPADVLWWPGTTAPSAPEAA